MTDNILISYDSDKFPSGSIANGRAELKVTWDDILWAAITVGRPNRNYVFRHGDSSIYEAIFRWSLVRMSLEQSGVRRYRLCRTNAAKTLDPTEKGAINYFLGMSFCKLFAAKLLDTPWLLHLDVFGQQLKAELTSRSRPDLIGMEEGTGRWHAFECKGRLSKPNATVKNKAKEQAQRIVSVDGIPCKLHIGSITYFKNDILNFYWRDPLPEKGKTIKIFLGDDIWRHYYAPIIGFLAMNKGYFDKIQHQIKLLVPIENLDISIGVHPIVAKLLFHGKWDLAHKAAIEAASELKEANYKPDGICIKAGDSWHKKFKEIS